MVPAQEIPLEDGTKVLLPVLVITCAYSRFILARLVPTRHTADLLLGMWELLQQLGRVPRRLIWDNESGIGRGKRHAEGVGAFAGTLATTLQRLKPYDPESKGIVERRNGFFETSFMPGRDFESPADFDAQFTAWLDIANARIVRTIKTRPVDPAVIGRFVDVHADLTRVEVRHEGRLVAGHDRVWARGTTISDPTHVAAAKTLREQYQQPRPALDPDDELVRDLADYDRAFGLIDTTLVDATTDGMTDGMTDGEVA